MLNGPRRIYSERTCCHVVKPSIYKPRPSNINIIILFFQTISDITVSPHSPHYGSPYSGFGIHLCSRLWSCGLNGCVSSSLPYPINIILICKYQNWRPLVNAPSRSHHFVLKSASERAAGATSRIRDKQGTRAVDASSTATLAFARTLNRNNRIT